MMDDGPLSRLMAWGALAVVLVVLVLLVPGVTNGQDDPGPPLHWYDATVTEVDSWRDPSGQGTDLVVFPSPDGARLLVWGYGGPADVRVMGRDGDTLRVLDLPGENATVKGVLWSWGDSWLAAWGRAEGGTSDFLALWDADTYEPSDQVLWDGRAPLPVVDALYFMTDDAILGLAGRDANGTSRVLVLETTGLDERSNITWEGNATVLYMTTDSRDLICVDELGGLTSISSREWDVKTRHQGISMRPTASSNAYTRDTDPWIYAFENGSYQVWRCCPWDVHATHRTDGGAVQAATFVNDPRGEFYMLALPRDGGSRMLVYRGYFDLGGRDLVAEPFDTAVPTTMMTKDPATPGQVWVGASDGTLTLLNVSLTIDLPPEAYILEPEHNKDFFGDSIRFSGNCSDDHDNITWVRISVDDGEWQDVDWAGGEWSWELDISDMKEETNHRVTVMASDGRHGSNGHSVFFNIFEPEEDERGVEFGWKFWVGLVLGVVVIALLVLRFARGD